jgi:hypothetical protein
MVGARSDAAIATRTSRIVSVRACIPLHSLGAGVD